jgi:hypothetical protein
MKQFAANGFWVCEGGDFQQTTNEEPMLKIAKNVKRSDKPPLLQTQCYGLVCFQMWF